MQVHTGMPANTTNGASKPQSQTIDEKIFKQQVDIASKAMAWIKIQFSKELEKTLPQSNAFAPLRKPDYLVDKRNDGLVYYEADVTKIGRTIIIPHLSRENAQKPDKEKYVQYLPFRCKEVEATAIFPDLERKKEIIFKQEAPSKAYETLVTLIASAYSQNALPSTSFEKHGIMAVEQISKDRLPHSKIIQSAVIGCIDAGLKDPKWTQIYNSKVIWSKTFDWSMIK